MADKTTKTEEIGIAEWIPKQLKINRHDNFYPERTDETSWERLIRKFTENPLVPIGMVATVGALTYGLFQFKKGNSMQQQYAMRARVTFQGVTLAALGLSMFWQNQRMSKKKESETETETTS